LGGKTKKEKEREKKGNYTAGGRTERGEWGTPEEIL